MPRLSRTALELYLRTISYFKELITSTAGIMGLPARPVVESLAIEMLDDLPWPKIEDVEWNFATWPFQGMSVNE